jgi:hypothetical protein
MKKTIQVLSLAASAALIVGCSSNEYTQTPTPPNGTSVDMSRNSDGTAGNTAYNFNQGSYTPKPEVTLDQLPQAAQITIRNQIGDDQIVKIKEVSKDGQTAYRVELQRKDWHSERPTLVVAADGSILKESHMRTINEAAGAQAPESSALDSIPNSPSTAPNPAQPYNPAAPTPAFPPASVLSDR